MKLKKCNHTLRRTNITHKMSKQLMKQKVPQCTLANLEISCLLKIGDISRKL
jgi:hypothetical protein